VSTGILWYFSGMTWTYSAANRTARNRVRERIGDAVSSRPWLDDEIIDEALTSAGGGGSYASELTVAVFCARLVLARLVGQVDRSVETLSITRRNDAYADLVKGLEAEAGVGVGVAGVCITRGTSLAERVSVESDADYESSPFSDKLWGRAGGSQD
jgi:hypothetical protein